MNQTENKTPSITWQKDSLKRIERIRNILDQSGNENRRALIDIGEMNTYYRQIKRHYKFIAENLKKDIDARISHLEKIVGIKK